MPTTTFTLAADGNNSACYRGDASWANVVAGGGTFGVDSDSVWVAKYSPGDFYAEVGLFRWDTSSLPDNATITSANLKVYLIARTSQFGVQSLEADWFDYGGSPPTAADWTLNIVGTSIFTPVTTTTLTTAAVNTLALTDLTGINLTGFSGIRLAISNVTVVNNSQEVLLEFSTLAEGNPAQLEVTYTTPAVGVPIAWTVA